MMRGQGGLFSASIPRSLFAPRSLSLLEDPRAGCEQVLLVLLSLVVVLVLLVTPGLACCSLFIASLAIFPSSHPLATSTLKLTFSILLSSPQSASNVLPPNPVDEPRIATPQLLPASLGPDNEAALNVSLVPECDGGSFRLRESSLPLVGPSSPPLPSRPPSFDARHSQGLDEDSMLSPAVSVHFVPARRGILLDFAACRGGSGDPDCSWLLTARSNARNSSLDQAQRGSPRYRLLLPAALSALGSRPCLVLAVCVRESVCVWVSD
eukprot:3916741-Rhodomonas_salina.1